MAVTTAQPPLPLVPDGARPVGAAAPIVENDDGGRVYVRAVTQLEISSTELRALIIAGRDPRYLVPDPVRQIILETRCYAARHDPRP